MHATNKFGDVDVWNLAFNMDDARWCVVRDMNNALMFDGYIRAFSDVGENVELLLTQVHVYNEQTAELCYEADRMYLARKRDDLTIQFQIQDLNQGKEPTDGGKNDKNSADPSSTGGDGKEGGTESAQHEYIPPGQASRELSSEQQR